MLKKYNTSIVSKITAILLLLVFVITSAYLPGNEISAASAPSKPKQVTLVSAKALNPIQVKVTWKKISGVTGYQVYRKQGTGKWAKIATVKSANKKTYTDKKAKANTKHQYKVRAYKKKGKNKYKYYDWSAKKEVTTPVKEDQTIKASDKSVAVGEKVELEASASSKLALTYASSDKSVATVSKRGVVTGRKAGKATITIKQAGNERYNPASKTVTVEVDPDPEFTESVLSKTETYIKDYQAATAFLLDSRGRITWTEDDPDNVISITVDPNGHQCTVKFNKAGSATLTAKSETSGKIKSIELIIASSIMPGEDEEDNGIKTPYGSIYPNEGTEKSFNISRSSEGFLTINGVTTGGSAESFINYLPDGSEIYLDAVNMARKHPVTPNPNWTGARSIDGQSGWFGKNVFSSNKNVALFFTDQVDSGLGTYFIDSGTTTITFQSTGKKMEFHVTGRNTDAYNYAQYVKRFVEENRGKDHVTIANNACAKIANISYGPSNEGLTVIGNNYGNCWGKNYLLYRLMKEFDIEVQVLNVTPQSGSHMCCEITINGISYIADPTIYDELMTREKYSQIASGWIIGNSIKVGEVQKIAD